MILFKKDWVLYPSAIVHVTTKNETFLRLAGVYRDMGIENHVFLLALIQPELAEVDPYDPNLDTETMAKIIYEITINPWYFFREIVKAPPQAGIIPDPFKANRANISAYWLFFLHVTFILIQPRQTGKSFSIDCLMIYLLNYGVTHTLINMLTRSDDLRDQNLNRLKKIQEELPFYVNMKKKGDIFNTEEIRINLVNNEYKGHLSNASPKLAGNVGRGFTSPITHIDEACFVPNIGIALPAALMAGNAARDSARRNNSHYGTILTTTAGKIDDRDGAYVYGLLNNSTVWDDKFLDAKDSDELYRLILSNSRATDDKLKRPIINSTFSYRQLGYTDAWMKQKLEETIADGEDADRDLFNKWTSGSQSSPIPREYMNLIRESVRDTHRTEIYKPYNYVLRWFISEEEVERRVRNNNSFIIGVDTSDAVGRDDIAMVIRDHTNAEVICVATFNEINLITLADFFVNILVKYLNSTMIIERRSSAAAIIDYILQKLPTYGINPFKRLFNQIVQRKDELEKEFDEIRRSNYYNAELLVKYKKYFGFTTSFSGNTSRSELYSTTLIACSKYSGRYIYDQQLANQMLSLVIKNNRVDHPTGGNDDLVIANLLSYWLISTGKNLDFYGIDRNTILRYNEDYLNEKYSDINIDKEDMMIIEEEFNNLVEKYKAERCESIAMKIEMKLKMLANELNNQHNQAISVEQMLEDINSKKRLKYR